MQCRFSSEWLKKGLLDRIRNGRQLAGGCRCSVSRVDSKVLDTHQSSPKSYNGPGIEFTGMKSTREQQAFETLGARKRGQRRRSSVPAADWKYTDYHDVGARGARPLPWSAMMATVVGRSLPRWLHQNAGCAWRKWNNCPARAPFSKRFEDAGWGRACEGGSGIAVGRQFGLSARQVLRIEQALPSALGREAGKSAAAAHGSGRDALPARRRSSSRWSAIWKRASLSGSARNRKEETLDVNTSGGELNKRQRGQIEAACRWTCGNRSPRAFFPAVAGCRIVFDKFHVMQHANDAIDEVRRAEFFPQGNEDA